MSTPLFGFPASSDACGCACSDVDYWCFSPYGVEAGVGCGDDQGASSFTSPTGADSDGHMDIVYPFVSGFDYSTIPFVPCTDADFGAACEAKCATGSYLPSSGMTVFNPGPDCQAVYSYFDWFLNGSTCGAGGDTCNLAKVGAAAAGLKFNTNIPFNVGKAVYTDEFTLTITDVCHNPRPSKDGGCSSDSTNFFYLPPPPLSLTSSWTCSDDSGTVTIPLGAYYFLVGATPDQTGTLTTCVDIGGGTTFCYEAGGTECMESGDPFDGDPP